MKKSEKSPKTEIETEIETEVISHEPEPEPTPEPEPEHIPEPEPEPIPEPEIEPEPTHEPVIEGAKKRGRPRKNTEAATATEKPKKENPSKKIEAEIFSEKPEPEKAPDNQKAEKPKQLFAISGEMLLGAIDMAAPLVVTTIGGFLEPELKKVPFSRFQMDEIEKKTLLPAAEAVARENIQLTPMEMLLGGLAVIYFGKTYQVITEIKSRKK